MTCFSGPELDAMEAEADRIVQETADAAVKVAVAPYMADLAGERAKSAGWEAVYRKTAADLATAQYWALWGWIGTAVAAGVAVLAILIR
jgi:hypothetical protein